jgi:hypothetical protein
MTTTPIGRWMEQQVLITELVSPPKKGAAQRGRARGGKALGTEDLTVGTTRW